MLSVSLSFGRIRIGPHEDSAVTADQTYRAAQVLYPWSKDNVSIWVEPENGGMVVDCPDMPPQRHRFAHHELQLEEIDYEEITPSVTPKP
ncbi:MAG: hypothetical protein AB7P76_10575 [Candidatus Melainabacteria bacterium]